MPELQGGEHAFIHNRAGRQAGNIKRRAHHLALGDNLFFRHFADDVQFAFKIHLAFHIRGLADKHLDDARTDRLGRFPDDTFVNGNLAPAQNALPFLPDDPFKDLHLFFPEGFIPVGKHHAYTVLARRGQ